ncbi:MULTISPECIES: amino acid ABC transporter permease [Nocardia]|jgi:glutamate transport system permease protein|uniref:amino acid ABC transporter permease n=1 Tax=Nocardia TaxID=1817 RepID=UPI0007E9D131|nr:MULTISPECIES: amino acid ABC transporter permease [Nocardia]OBF87285.1 glutamate ABC transporter permease [Mycobacterium sp. 852002-51759_SCH5129042]MBF6274430.1 amino acid ABC transporter permease [Nocardia nova]MBV7704043.1 amino acid ABC transporter permease [Nocardia nova]OBA54234.1 glutamate ABC transporter permease [Nocardia sp. 852002-51101_SCH5132738]OBB53328.1 glutamate ABC transporter permease [Nocardia sp. 852002-51244_SCH5132740]
MSANASVLYDVPGPKARRRHALYSVLVLAVLVVLGWLVWRAFDEKGQLTAEKWKPFVESEVWQTYILPGLRGTLVAAALAIVFAMVIGVVFGLLRLSEHRVVRWVAGVIVEVARAIPVLILMIFLYNWFAKDNLFASDQLALAAVVIALTVYNGSVIAEIVRSGIRSLPRGQTEAAQALGLRKAQMMRIILLPQAVTAMLPALISQMVVALKDTALGYQITYQEIVRQGQQLGAAEQNTVPALIVVAVIMIALNWALTVLATRVEQRLRSRRRGRTVLGVNSVLTDAAPGVDLSLSRTAAP